MLEQAIKDQVTQVFSNLKSQFTFQVTAAENHPNKNELTELLNDVAACSDKVDTQINSGEGLSFTILRNNESSGVIFRAVPTGHEFTTLLLAVLNLDGIGKNLPDEMLSQRIKNISTKVQLKSYISLSCTNCPDVVQALNIMAFLNPAITHEIIDGGINKSEVEALDIQAVPSVYANGEQLHVGRSSLGELLAKIEDRTGAAFKPAESIKKEYDVVVVGGGPAGVSAAVYSARKGFSTAIVAETIGGQVTETVSIENMISVPQTTGAELSANLMKHLNDYPIDILENRLVEKTELIDGKKHITTSLGETFITPALIIATGASWRKLGVPGESEYIGSGVAFCTHCDGPFYKDKKVVVVGGGNSGLEAAIDLSSIAAEVTVLEFLDTLKGDQVLQDKLAQLSNVKIITNAQTLSVNGDGNKVKGLDFKHRETETVETIQTDGVFVQIGLQANSKVFTDVVETNRMGEIEIDAHCRTNVPGVYAAGDVSVVPYKQIVIAMGEGSKAALSAFEDSIKGKLIQN
ncbi:alkyl hydroperoxide reductase subunit F [Carboxylicivirga sp. RSCT41]|uniref:alkyl hydroperoxide reductase subunit F n=1 Tax=Carboxylicivirga agarovorans TaxID=3417570 RepID=UPI003D32ED0F